MNDRPFDVLGIGCIAVDETLYTQAYPEEDEKEAVLSRSRSIGGITANALVAAARLGLRSAFAGTLGHDAASQFAIDDLYHRGINTQWIRRDDSARPIQCTVLSTASGTRTVLYDLAGARGGEEDWPPEEAFAQTRYLLIDHFGVEGMLRAAKLAKASGVVVVADFENYSHPLISELISHVDYLFIPAASMCYIELEDLRKPRPGTIYTRGEDGTWVFGPAFQKQEARPTSPVNAVETIGCGDVLRGAFVAALMQGHSPDDALDMAMRAATLKATRRGGRDSYPESFS